MTHDVYCRQKDGLEMESTKAPPSNGWLYSYDLRIRDNSRHYSRYMDDNIQAILKNKFDDKLQETGRN